MNPFSRIKTPVVKKWRQRVLPIAATAIVLASAWNSAIADAQTTNAPGKWPSLAEVKQKWGNATLVEVQRAAEGGDLTAQHYLGYCNMEGFRVAKNPAAAITWYQRAIESGYLPSASNLGVAYQKGTVGSTNLEKALYYYRYAADRGFAPAQSALGFLYHDGVGVERDPAEAFRWFQVAADQGQTGAMTELYFAYWQGNGVAIDHKAAMTWLVKSAEAGSAYAQCLLGYRYENPERRSKSSPDGPPPNMLEAARWYGRSADQNWADGQYYLALCYLAGNGVEQDEERGLELIRKGADQNHAASLLALTKLYATGVGEPRNDADRPVALLLRLVSGEQENEDTIVHQAYDLLVFRYEYGVGTPRDIIAAVRWYGRGSAAEVNGFTIAGKLEAPTNDPFSGSMMGRVSERIVPGPSMSETPGRAIFVSLPNHGAESDQYVVTMSRYLKAAVSGNSDCMMELGEMYLNGYCVPKSSTKAWPWFSLALQKNAPGAAAKLASATAQMDESEMKEAEQQLAGLQKELKEVAAAYRRDDEFQKRMRR